MSVEFFWGFTGERIPVSDAEMNDVIAFSDGFLARSDVLRSPMPDFLFRSRPLPVSDAGHEPVLKRLKEHLWRQRFPEFLKLENCEPLDMPAHWLQLADGESGEFLSTDHALREILQNQNRDASDAVGEAEQEPHTIYVTVGKIPTDAYIRIVEHVGEDHAHANHVRLLSTHFAEAADVNYRDHFAEAADVNYRVSAMDFTYHTLSRYSDGFLLLVGHDYYDERKDRIHNFREALISAGFEINVLQFRHAVCAAAGFSDEDFSDDDDLFATWTQRFRTNPKRKEPRLIPLIIQPFLQRPHYDEKSRNFRSEEQTELGLHCLFRAVVSAGDEDLARVFAESPHLDVNFVFPDGESVIDRAIRKGHHNVVEVLLELRRGAQ